jgi:hypothetical protein
VKERCFSPTPRSSHPCLARDTERRGAGTWEMHISIQVLFSNQNL